MTEGHDKDRSYQGANMFKGVLGLYYYNKKCKKAGTKSGYEKLIAAAPEDLIPMAEYIVDKMAAHSAAVAKTTADLRENPEAYIDLVEGASAFRRQELLLYKQGKFRQGASAEYTAGDYDQDQSLGRSGLSSSYLSRKIVIDKAVREAIENGATQIVIPACGLDMVAERYARKFPNVQFSLSDLPAIIEERKELEDEGFRKKFFGGKKLANLHFGSADLEKPDALVKLLASTRGFDKNKKTLYVFEGISMYLTPKSIQKLERDINRTTPDHEIIMTFMFHSTEAERRLVNGTYEGKTVLPIYQVQKYFICGNAVQPAYSMKGLPGVDSFDGLVDWKAADKKYLDRHPESGLTMGDLEEARAVYQTTGGAFLHLKRQYAPARILFRHDR